MGDSGLAILKRGIGFQPLKRKGELLPQWAQIQTSELRVELEDSLLLPKPADCVSAAFPAARKLAQRLPFELRNRVRRAMNESSQA